MVTMKNQSSVGPRGLKRTVAPTLQVISVATFKQHARIDVDDDDTLIAEYLEAATEYVEKYQNRCWRQATWQAAYDCFPADCVFYLSLPPLVSVTSIVYLDSAGDSQTLSTDYYTVDAISQPGRVALKFGQVWPSTYDQIGAVTITYVAGYSSASDVPARVKHAIRLVAAHSYENREPVNIGSITSSIPLSATEIMSEDRFVSYR